MESETRRSPSFHRGMPVLFALICVLSTFAGCATTEQAGGDSDAAGKALAKFDPALAERWRAITAVGDEGAESCKRALDLLRNALSRETRDRQIEALAGAYRVLKNAVEEADSFLNENRAGIPQFALALCVDTVALWQGMMNAASVKLPPQGGDEETIE